MRGQIINMYNNNNNNDKIEVNKWMRLRLK